MSELSADWTCVKSSVSRKKILESDLVLTSMGIDTRIERRLFEWRLLTRLALASHARLQLDLYYQENREAERPHAIFPTLGDGIKGAVFYLLVIWLFFVAEGIGLIDGMRSGALYSPAVEAGAWWLTITAMTLHADLGHIVANSVSGAFFGFIAGRYFGDGFAWLLILVSGALANYLNALVRPDDVVSIGASTACFAAAGLVAGYTWRRTFVKGASAKLNYLPIAAAIGIFIFMGISGENTDVIGHLMGLVVGLVVGAVIGKADLRRLGRSGQRLSAYSSVLLLCVAWFFAI